MKRTPLGTMTVDQLVDHFVAIALDQDQAIRMDDNAKFNRLFRRMEAVEQELKARHGDQRRALTPLFGHPNAQVRLKAAIAALVVDRPRARQALQVISDRREYPQAADARGMMRALDEGTYVPK